MYNGKSSQRKSCIIDEAWDLFGGENEGAAEIYRERDFRTTRKYNAVLQPSFNLITLL